MMKVPRDLEYRTLRFLEASEGATPLNGDAEPPSACFAQWPGPPLAAARTLAAHANAARGRDLLWLLGVKDGEARGADPARLDGWLASVAPFFDGLAPRVTGFGVPTGRTLKGKPVQLVALHIETQRAPFVVRPRRHGHGPGGEVPWLEAETGAVRTAGRLELVKLLAPLQDLPQIEVLDAELTFYRNLHVSSASKTAYRWTLDGSVYVLPGQNSRVVVPLHRCRGSIASADGSFTSEGSDLSLTADKGSPAIRVTETAALIEGLGRVFVYCCGATPQLDVTWPGGLKFRFELVPAGVDRAATAQAALRPEPVREGNQVGRWKL